MSKNLSLSISCLLPVHLKCRRGLVLQIPVQFVNHADTVLLNYPLSKLAHKVRGFLAFLKDPVLCADNIP